MRTFSNFLNSVPRRFNQEPRTAVSSAITRPRQRGRRRWLAGIICFALSLLLVTACTDTSPSIETSQETTGSSAAPTTQELSGSETSTTSSGSDTDQSATTADSPTTETTNSDTSDPDTSDPDTTSPDTTDSDTSDPDSTNPDVSDPEAPATTSSGPSCGDPANYSLANELAEGLRNPIADELNLVEPDPDIAIEVLDGGTAPCFDLEYELSVGSAGSVTEDRDTFTVTTTSRVIDSIEGYVLIESIANDGTSTRTTLELITTSGLRIGTRGPSGPIAGEVPSPDGSFAILPPTPLGVGAKWRLSLGDDYTRSSELVAVDGKVATITSTFTDGTGAVTGTEYRELYLDRPTPRKVELEVSRNGDSTRSAVSE